MRCGLLRLAAEVDEVFTERLQQAFPLRAAKVLSILRAMRGGRSNDSRFGSRMRGEGARWQLIADLFARTARRLGIAVGERAGAATVSERILPTGPSPFRRPHRQQSLFGGEAGGVA